MSTRRRPSLRRLSFEHRRREFFRPRGEELEKRAMLSTIELSLRGFEDVFGTTPFLDIDKDGNLETRSEVAKNVVRTAAERWEAIIGDFNYTEGNTYELEVGFRGGVNDFGAVTSTDTFGYDVGTGSPTGATVLLGRGADIDGDGDGDGWGYFIDPTPNDWAEFPKVVNAFAGQVDFANPHPALLSHDFDNNGVVDWIDFGTDNDGNGTVSLPEGILSDFYTLVAHEIGHAMGFSSHPFVDFPNGFANDTGAADPDQNGTANGNLWLWASPRAPRVLLTTTNGTGSDDAPVPIHVAATGVSLTLADGREFSGITDLMNPFYPPNERHLISDLDVAVLHDSFDYGNVADPEQWGTLYTSLDEVSGLLTIRGGTAASDDSTAIIASSDGNRITVRTRVGNPVLGSLAWMGVNGEYESQFPASSVKGIVVDLGDGNDHVSVSLAEISATLQIDTMDGDDTVLIRSIGSTSSAAINLGTGEDRVEIGRAAPGADIRVDSGVDWELDIVQVGLSVPSNSSLPEQEMQGSIAVTLNRSLGTPANIRDQVLFRDAHRPVIGDGVGTVSFAAGGAVTPINGTYLESPIPIDVRFEAQAQSVDNLFTIEDLLPRDYATYTIVAPAQSDNTLLVADLGNLLGSQLYFEADGGHDDEVIIHDLRTNAPAFYAIDEPFDRPGTSRLREGAGLHSLSDTQLEFRTVDTQTLHTAPAGSTVAVLNDDVNHQWVIEGGTADDVVVFSPIQVISLGGFPVIVGGDVANIDGFYTIRGGGGTNRIELVDTRANNSNRFVLSGNQIDFDELRTVRQIVYEGVQSVQIYASDLADFFDVFWAPFGSNLELFGNDGGDTFTIGQGNLFEEFESNIRIDGGEGDDRINLHDENATTPGGYVFDAETASDGVLEAHFQKWFATLIGPFPIVNRSGKLNARGVEHLELQGSARGDVFDIGGTLPALTYNLFGNDGADDFRIDGHFLQSRINVFGGPPTAAASPGDRMTVLGTDQDTGSYLPGTSSNNGRVTANGHNIDFSGLEPVYVEGFGSFDFVTPRSRDFVEISEYTDPLGSGVWTQIAGVSGIQNIPFEVLRARDIGTLGLNVAAFDLIPEPIYNAFIPNDIVTIYPFALSGNRVDRLRLIAGFGSDLISDRTLQGAPATTQLEIISLAPYVRHELWGQPYRVELGTVPGGLATTRAFAAGGQLLHDVRQINVGDVVFPYPLNQVEYVGANVETTLDEGEAGRQRLSTNHAPTRFEYQPISSGLFAATFAGDSTIAIIAILRSSIILRDGAGENILTFRADADVADVLAGRAIRLEGFSSEDTLQFEGLTRAGTPQDTTFVFDGRGLLESEPSVFIELLVLNALFPLQFQVGNLTAGTTPPKAVYEGGEGTVDEARVFATAGSGFDFIELLIRKIELLTMNGEERVDLSTRPDGGLSVQADGIRVTTDESTTRTALAARSIGVEYPERDFRPLLINTTRSIELFLRPNPEAIIAILRNIDQHLAPSFGTINFGNWTLNHGDTPREFRFEGSDIRSRMTGVFNRRITQRHRLTGSDSTIIVDGATLPGLDVTIEGAEGADNRAVMAMVDSTFTYSSSLTYEGPSIGQNTIVLGRNGVTYDGAAATQVNVGGTSDTVLFEASSKVNGNATTTAIDVNGSPATVFSSALDSVVPMEHFGIFATLRQDPEALLALNRAKAAARELAEAPLSRQVVSRLPAADPRELVLTGTGAIDVVAIDETPAGTNISVDTTGELQISREGNVTVSVPALVGTDIDLEGPLHICVVTNTNGSGPGSLREALECSYAAPGDALAIVTFAIPTTDPNFIDVDSHLPGGDDEPDAFFISPLSALPTNFRGRVVVNGQSQHNLTGDSNPFGPEIVLAGHLAGPTASGLTIGSLDNRIHGLNIQGFGGNGVYITGSGNVVTGSYIGTDPTGSSTVSTGQATLFADDFEADLANWTGKSLGPHSGVIVADPLRPENRVLTFTELNSGGDVFGPEVAVAPGQRYFVSFDYLGRTELGGYYDNLGGFIGFAEDSVPNGHRWIAGTAPVAGAQDLLIDDGQWHSYEIEFDPFQSGPNFDGSPTNNVIRVMIEDFIAAAVTAGDVLFDNLRLSTIAPISTANGASGILIVNGRDNVVGGTAAGQRNVISGNSLHGVHITGNSFPLGDGPIVTDNPDQLIRRGNVVVGNFIGTTANSSAPLANAQAGVYVQDSAYNRIGGPSPLERNVLSGNQTGVWILGALSNENHVAGNFIGLAADGLTALGNTAHGVLVSGLGNTLGGAGNLIGGTEASLRNVISANGQNNISLASSGTMVQGNYIGSDATGTRLPQGLGRGRVGVRVNDDVNSIIGGNTPGAGNVIVGHIWGVYLSGRHLPGGAQGTRIQRNSIGILADGETPLANIWGVDVDGFVDSDGLTRRITDVLIGGTEPGAGNVISGNANQGIRVHGPGAEGIVIQGDWIGTDRSGWKALPNGPATTINGAGILLDSASGVQIGGADDGARNIISGNNGSGISITGGSDHTIQGNYIGTTADGNFPQLNRGPSSGGIKILNSSGNLIGGTEAGARNVIGGSAANIDIRGAGSIDNSIQGNFIGVAADGENAISQAASERGVLISDGARRTVIGGGEEGAGNVIAGHSGNSIEIFGGGENSIARNRIGTNADGEVRIGNVPNYASIGGIRLVGVPETQIVDNLISGNLNGIRAEGASSNLEIRGNRIGTNLAGSAKVPNQFYGIVVDGVNGAVIGGYSAEEANLISGNGSGVFFANGGEHRVVGNWIGTDWSGTELLGNMNHGIYVSGADDVVIGGPEPGAGNLISGNTWGIQLLGGATGVKIQANRIGTDVTGTEAIPNAIGVSLRAPDNFLGTDGDGIEDSREGNLISGNTSVAVEISQIGTEDNIVAGNLIGTDHSGLVALPNKRGLSIVVGAANNRIGTNSDGTSDGWERNVIAGSVDYGIVMENSSGSLIAGNYIGVDATGMAALGNHTAVYIGKSTDNTVGGASPAAGNVISGNRGTAVYIVEAPAMGNVVQNNLIGTTADGAVALGNAQGGVYIVSASATTVEGNVIAQNGATGVAIQGATATGNVVRGNRIGTNAAGTADFGNAGDGVSLALGVSGALIADNLISGNAGHGVNIVSSSGNVVQDNLIGTTADGLSGLGNAANGILLSGTATDNQIVGGVVAANMLRGIRIQDPTTRKNTVRGVIIGADLAGATALGNGYSGILISNSPENVIEENILSGNRTEGVAIQGMVATSNVLRGNRIGTTADGRGPLGNVRDGVALTGNASATTIVDNVISANGRSGVRIEGTAASGNLLAGNVIGTDALGTLDLGNAIMGVWIINSPGNTVHDNLISGNNVNGLVISGTSARGNLAEHNFIGTDATGTYAIGNFLGIHLADAPDNQILSNLVSGNVVGLDISGAGAGGNLVRENHIGTRIGGTGPLPNTADGVFIDNSPGNTLERNTIAANGFNGVLIAGEGSLNNVLLGNTIGAVAASPAPIATFNFESSLDDAQSARSLVPFGTGRFVTDTVFGTQRTVYEFDTASGLTLDTNGLLGLETYSIEVVFRFDDVVSWQKIVDFENRTEDTGLYVYDGALQFYPENPGGVYWPGRYHRIVLTRAANGEVIGYVDGSEAFRFEDATDDLAIADIDNPENLLHFFLDDVATLYEETSAGRIAQLQIYSNALSATQVVGLGDLGNRGDGIQISGGASHNTIGGNGELARNIISGNHDSGIRIVGGEQNTIQGNYIGTNPDGSVGLPNTANGVFIDDAPHNTLANNNISANGFNGVLIEGTGSFGNVLSGNLIGTDVNGANALGNTQNGVRLTGGASNNQLVDNLISANGWSGIAIEGLSTTATSVIGNRIGTDASGQVDLGNRVMGVWVVGSSGNQIGGQQPGQGNLISGNDVNGVVIAGASASANLVVNNLIGTDATGTYALGNFLGIHLADAPGNTVTGNLLSGNVVGLDISGATASGNLVWNNLIGATADGNGALGNLADGVFIDDAPRNTLIGNTVVANGLRGILVEGIDSVANRMESNYVGVNAAATTGLGNALAGLEIRTGQNNEVVLNTIAYNLGAGVAVNGVAVGNTIRQNSIHSNDGLGIDLADDGVTPNDHGDLSLEIWPDADSGSNTLQNFPQINSVQPGTETKITGTLRSTPGATFLIDFYASLSADPSGHGEGQRWLGSASVLANAEGVARFNATVTATTFGGENITATATRLVDADLNPATPSMPADTSEFSAAYLIKSGKGVRGPNTFALEIFGDGASDSAARLATTLDVQVVGLASAQDGQPLIDVETFAAAIGQSPRGPIGLPFQLAAYSSAASPRLLEAVAQGLSLGHVELVGQSSIDGIPYEFARWSFDNVRIGSFFAKDFIEDQFTLVYDRLEYEYTPLTASGAPGTSVSGVWDVLASGGIVESTLADTPLLPSGTDSIRYFIEIPGITGDSQREEYPGWIEAMSVEFAMLGADPQHQGSTLASTIGVVAESGRASPRLLAAAASGEVFAKPIQIVAVRDLPDMPGEYARWELSGATLASFATSSGKLDGFSIAFDALQYSFADFAPDGSLLPPVIASLHLAEAGIENYTRGVDLSDWPLEPDGNATLVRIPGVVGDSQLAGYVGWVHVNEFQFQMERSLSSGASQATSFGFLTPTGRASPSLFGLATSEGTLASPVDVARLQITSRGAKEVSRWTLGGAEIGDFATTSAVLDGFTVGFDVVHYQSTPLDSAGRQLPPIVGEWNLAADGIEAMNAPLEPPIEVPLAADVSLFVKIPGIKGSATLAGYVDWIPIDDFSFELSNPFDDDSGRAFASTFHFDAPSSKASPEIWRSLLTGRQIPGAEVAAVRKVSGSKVEEFARWSLSNIQIASFATENSWQDVFALSFDTLSYAFTPPVIKKGTASPVTAHWNPAATGSEVLLVQKGKPDATLPTDVQVLVEIPGISGSSQLQEYVGWIELESARVQAFRPLGNPASAPVLSTFQFVSLSGLSSPQLMQALADRQVFSGKEAIQVVTLRQLKDGSIHELARWSMDEASLTSLANHSARQDGFSVAYGQLDLAYTPISSSGTPEPSILVAWDLDATGTQLGDRGAELSWSAVPGDVDLLLRVPGITGNSTREGFSGWIEINSWGFSLEQPRDGRVEGNAGPLVIDLPTSLASPLLLEEVADGMHVPKLELVAIRKVDAAEFARLVFDEVTLTQFQTTGSLQDGLAVEFGRLTFTSNELDPQTGKLLHTTTGTWPAAGGSTAEESFPAAQALLADSYVSDRESEPLSAASLESIATEARQRWEALGAETSRLNDIEFVLTDLPGATLGMAHGNTIWIDAAAAGWGWFIDPTPWEDSEFTRPGDQGERDHMDLLSAVMHEMGHVLGLGHDGDGVMVESLAAGERLVEAEQDPVTLIDQVFGQADEHLADAWLFAWLNEHFNGTTGRSVRRLL